MRRIGGLAFLFTIASNLCDAQILKHTSTHVEPHSGPAIVSPKVPTDSRGETVYEVQGADQKDVAIVPGLLVAPSSIKTPSPKYPKSFRREHSSGEITAEGVISMDGRFIDAEIIEPVDPDAAKCVLDALANWTFHPGTLDGKPVAQRAKIVLSFRFI